MFVMLCISRTVKFPASDNFVSLCVFSLAESSCAHESATKLLRCKHSFTTVVTDLTRCHRTWFHKVRIFVDLTLLYNRTDPHAPRCSKWTSALLPHS